MGIDNTPRVFDPGWPLGSMISAEYGLPGMVFNGTDATGAWTLNRDYFWPIICFAELQVSDVAFRVSAVPGANMNARVGIMRAESGWRPTEVMWDSGNIAIAAAFTGLKNVTPAFGGSFVDGVLLRGVYMLVFNCDRTVTLQSYNGHSVVGGGLSRQGLLNASDYVSATYFPRAFGAFTAAGMQSWTTEVLSSAVGAGRACPVMLRCGARFGR